MIAWLSDVEGRWSKLEEFASSNPALALEGDAIEVKPGQVFVFGGDTIDRGPAGRRLVRALLDARLRQPDRVVLLAGNRDINKLRLATELRGAPHPRAPAGLSRAELLRWTLKNTMGAPDAFEHRRAELGGASDDDVVDSMLADLAPDGDHARLLAGMQLAWRSGSTLFVHGGVAEASLSWPAADDVDAWISGLNAFYAERVARFRDGQPRERWDDLIAYQAPLPGQKLNPGSVVYGRHTDDFGNPCLPAPAAIARLARSGITRVVVGHTPTGDCPSLVRQPGFELVMSDTSYSRLEHGPQVLIDGDQLRILGRAQLDGGEQVEVRGEGELAGKRDAETGALVKGRTPSGDWVLFQFLPNWILRQVTLSPEDARRRTFVDPR